MDHDEGEKADEVVLPGFRFHPTDEELVGFYLKRKIQHRPLSIELIKELDIYKYDPWDLPKMAATGEKEWYFYCPRDRKYRNSTRPNRVTKAGFWKATGTDRPVYSSEASKCIGLKKSLVFYKGRAAKGTKTDWMMHEFRLPCSSQNKTLPTSTSESWAICRIFRKTSSATHRTTSRSWISPSLPQTSLILNSNTTTPPPQTDQLSPENNAFVSMKTEPLPSMKMSSNGEYYSDEAVDNSSTSATDFPLFDFPPYYVHQHEMMLPPLMDASLPGLLPQETKHDHRFNNGDISCVLGDYVGNINNNNEACMSLQLEGGLHEQLIIGNGGVFSNGMSSLQGGAFDRRDDLWDVVKSYRFPISAASEIGL